MNIGFNERPIDRQASAFLCRGSRGAEAGILRTAVSLLSQAVGQGSICLDLEDIATCTVVGPEMRETELPDADGLRQLLEKLPTVGRPGQRRPMVLDDSGRLYFYRYWRYESMVAERLDRMASAVPPSLERGTLDEGLGRLFPADDAEREDHQKLAAKVALQRCFSVISGGPGTGKTSTVVRILCLLLEQPGGARQRIAMAAPTGKAAARLKSSISAMRHSLPCPDGVKDAMPSEVGTIHRLLGPLPGISGFRHSASNPLPFDTVIVDEASMIDLPLMSALLDAVPPHARLILLGDRDQLASVDPGAVLGDICRAGEERGSAVEGCITPLTRNFRFGAASGIGGLARAVNAGDDVESMRLLLDERVTDAGWRPLPEPGALRHMLAKEIVEGYRPWLEAESPAGSVQLFDRFRVLCALREGPFGVFGMNRSIETLLAGAGLISPSGLFWRGRPVLITENDPSSRLFNGDTGILLPDPDAGKELRAWFPAHDGTMRSLPPERLPKHETAFAMTVHKSQGSEFDRVLLVLPPEDVPLLTRELAYTAITRAKSSIGIIGNETVFSAAVRRRTGRRSGLRDALVEKGVQRLI
ncbi:MAG: exodeoxyribonuclease V subunit alpha [Chlorobiaceae bacterium]|nr:exodeoxyribonuclease V subunit alpha [Chlorobiaceae bacterium]